MHNVKVLVKGKDRCTLLVHPDDAAALGLRHGDPARVTSEVGSLDVPVVGAPPKPKGGAAAPAPAPAPARGYGSEVVGLRLQIYSYKLVGGNGGQDVKEINVLNHYIGMRHIKQEMFPEFGYMGYVLGMLIAVGLLPALSACQPGGAS